MVAVPAAVAVAMVLFSPGAAADLAVLVVMTGNLVVWGLASLRIARHRDGLERGAWSWFAWASLGTVAFAVVLVAVSYATGSLDAIINASYLPSSDAAVATSSVMNLVIYGMAFVGLLFLARKAGSSDDTARLMLDAAIVAGSLFFILWSAVYRDIYNVSNLGPSTRFVVLSYPVLDSCLLTVALMALATPSPGRPRSYAIILPAFVALAVTDFIAAYVTLRAPTTGIRVSEVGQTIGLCLLAIGALAVARGPAWSSVAVRRPALWVQLLPIWPIALAMGAATVGWYERGALTNVQFWTAVLVIGLALARLGATLRENFLLTEAVESSSALKTQLLRFFAHEVANPLTPLRMELRKIRPQASQADSRSWQIIDRNMERLVALSTDVRDMSLAATGRLVPVAATSAVAPLVQAACDSMASVAAAREITITCTPDTDLLAHLNGPRLGQVLDNLLSNAIKFTPDRGHIDVVVKAEGQWAAIAVTDYGRGLTGAQIASLFQPFSRPNADKPGMGLGLYISSTIVKELGGRIEAASPGPGNGATFTVYLPRDEPASVPKH